jgi:hypothetical protein
MKKLLFILIPVVLFFSCKKGDSSGGGTIVPPSPVITVFNYSILKINDKVSGVNNNAGININPVIKISFSAPVDHSSASSAVNFNSTVGTVVPFTISYQNSDRTIVLLNIPST